MIALDSKKHKTHLINILVDIYKNALLGSILGFKGGTAAMLFYDLPRFSVDLDFDLIKIFPKASQERENFVTELTRVVKSKYQIKDQSAKYNTLFWLVSYGEGAANIKIEISVRGNPYNHYNLKPFYGVSVKVLDIRDMIAHKLVALTERRSTANRDLFDAHYFLSSKYVSEINYDVIKGRLGMNPKEFYEHLLEFLAGVDNRRILDGLGEILSRSKKDWVKAKLLVELKELVKRQRDLVGGEV